MNCSVCHRITFIGALCAGCATRAKRATDHTAGLHTNPDPRCIHCRGFRPADEIEIGQVGDRDFEVCLVLEVGGTILKLRRLDGSERFAHAGECRLVARARKRRSRGLQ